MFINEHIWGRKCYRMRSSLQFVEEYAHGA